ncbi:hypothetical protein ASPZODRAFT_77068 [Penicilliopsis zonata CBS 506.65]|uniref:Peptide hydrolase n=1 Tax=Penicilliopsis zonata CBS 506.65 TaxID=1073090 RepID=A0A1L9S5A9_9EURO|nr:hypothetical protein ASPZODRAFT_77068 [Penicilliopsis zonata CBS 506.65]OJJ42332.1 hypothetical protein ASPZODRAFT_77068 [Penicilliopsis zonata CBS 506.65]
MLVSTLLLCGIAQAAIVPPQVVFAPFPHDLTAEGRYAVDEAILTVLQTHSDPVAAMVALDPDSEALLAEPRLLHVRGEETAQWRTEGDKLRLRRQGRKFVDITDHAEFYALHKDDHDEPNLPELAHQRLVKPLFAHVETQRMEHVLRHMTSYYNRYYADIHGERSSEWLHDHIAEIIASSPFGTHISLEYFPHPFRQSSIIARFEPKTRNFSLPLTVIGAHQDSANYLFPLLPAPGADDDCSGTVSNLEAFRILAESGYTPKNGPVEFHWYAAEEGGELGSQDVARYKKEQGAHIGAMIQFDMTAFIARNATEIIAVISTETNEALTNWTLNLSKEYISIPSEMHPFGAAGSSDHAQYTRLGYPATFACEGNPMAGVFPGDFDPYIHGVHDTMDIDDQAGYFSLDHMARFTELAIAFAVEQAGWDNTWR